MTNGSGVSAGSGDTAFNEEEASARLRPQNELRKTYTILLSGRPANISRTITMAQQVSQTKTVGESQAITILYTVFAMENHLYGHPTHTYHTTFPLTLFVYLNHPSFPLGVQKRN